LHSVTWFRENALHIAEPGKDSVSAHHRYLWIAHGQVFPPTFSPGCSHGVLKPWAQTACKPQQPAGTVSAAVHGGRNPWRTSKTSRRKSGGTTGGTSVSTASGSRACRRPTRPRATRCGRRCTTCSSVPAQCQFLGVYAAENCLAAKGRPCYAFVYVGSEEDGNRFIRDMATTIVDRVRLIAEWISRSRPRMPAIPHRLEAAGGTDMSYWHPMEGEIPQARPEGTVPQAQDGPPEPQHKHAQHGDRRSTSSPPLTWSTP